VAAEEGAGSRVMALAGEPGLVERSFCDTYCLAFRYLNPMICHAGRSQSPTTRKALFCTKKSAKKRLDGSLAHRCLLASPLGGTKLKKLEEGQDSEPQHQV
jgi:hypothetical protein